MPLLRTPPDSRPRTCPHVKAPPGFQWRAVRKVAGQEDPDKKETGSEEEEGMLWKASRKGVRVKERPPGAGAQGQG